jgi:hypothetical protein
VKLANERIEFIYSVIGCKCWLCSYDKGPIGRPILDFHHVNPGIKSFDIARNITKLSWERIKEEIQKCILVCARCHREIELGLHSEEKIIQLHENFWIENTKKLDSYESVIKKFRNYPTYPIPPKEELLELRNKYSNKELAKHYGVGEGTIFSWVNRHKLPSKMETLKDERGDVLQN